MKRLQLTVITLVAIVASAMGQILSILPSDKKLIVSANNLTLMTALQFNLELPDGTTITNDATMGEAIDGHTLCIENLDNGDHLFILYSMDLNTFSDGELLRIPLATSNKTAKLYNIRFADTDAVSYEGEDTATGIDRPTPDPSRNGGEIYNLAGQRLSKMQKGININGGRKVLIK